MVVFYLFLQENILKQFSRFNQKLLDLSYMMDQDFLDGLVEKIISYK